MATPAFRCRCDRDTMPWTGGGALAVCPRCGGGPPALTLEQAFATADPAAVQLAAQLAYDASTYGFCALDLAAGQRVDPRSLAAAA